MYFPHVCKEQALVEQCLDHERAENDVLSDEGKAHSSSSMSKTGSPKSQVLSQAEPEEEASPATTPACSPSPSLSTEIPSAREQERLCDFDETRTASRASSPTRNDEEDHDRKASLTISIPSTPEMPMREMLSDASAAAAMNFFNCCATPAGAQTLGTPAAGHGFGTPVAVPQQQVLWYRVAFRGGVSVRAYADVNAPHTGMVLACNEVVHVSEAVPGSDGRIYLRLTSGRGWIFDDSALFPQDPSVVKGHWEPVASACGPGCGPGSVAPPSTPSVHLQGAMPQQQMQLTPCAVSVGPLCTKPVGECQLVHTGAGLAAVQVCWPNAVVPVPRRWKRGKRGGAKRRPKNQQNAAAATSSSMAASGDGPAEEDEHSEEN